MIQTLIKWRLNEVMARYGIKASDLAEAMSISKNSVSNLRGYEMPRLTEGTLNTLLMCLNQLKNEPGLITPNDLIDFSVDSNKSESH
ncbi:helix-turn-helix domain-containing protein [Chroococcidiopsis sp.]|uniref:helix-turn-helix domain-containing protein n=1 Tax=Chroococcidiopsis sp. TaxID=3088168 RepID=UPI003F353298